MKMSWQYAYITPQILRYVSDMSSSCAVFKHLAINIYMCNEKGVYSWHASKHNEAQIKLFVN